MTKLIETDEEVGKAGKGMIPRGGTSKLQLKLRSAGKGSPRTRRYLLNRVKGGPVHGEAAGRRKGVYKSNDNAAAPDALEALDSAIEKARGLIPKGGSSKLRNALWRRAERNQKRGGSESLKRSIRATSYLAGRRTGANTGPDRNYTKPITAKRTGKYK